MGSCEKYDVSYEEYCAAKREMWTSGEGRDHADAFYQILATCADGEPNVVPVEFKNVTENGKLDVGDVFLETTLKNIKENAGKIASFTYDAQSLEGYQVKGTAERDEKLCQNI